MKVKPLIIILFVFLMIPISSHAGPFDWPGKVHSKEPNAVEKEMGRLFRDMGVFKPPGTSEPIEFLLEDMDGRGVRISDFRGKILFLNFWATWCPPCKREMPSMEKLHQRLKNKDFVMIAIDLQEPASRVKKFFQDYKLTFISLLDSTGEVGRQFGVRSIPTTFILDKTGRVIGAAIGARVWDSKASIALFEFLTDMEKSPSSRKGKLINPE